MTEVGERVVTYQCGLRLMVGCASWLIFAIARSQAAPDAAQALPPGPGHDIAAAKCVSCHDATRLKSPGYSREGWHRVVSQMMHIGVTLTPEQVPVLTEYLVRSFPEKARPQATLIPGDVQVSFREWAVATPDAFPHDPLAATDGALWYTGQHASVLGRIDPGSGAIKDTRPTSRTQGLTDSPRIRPVISGSPRIRPPTSASSIRRAALSPTTRCPIRERATRTRRSSIAGEFSGSRCRAPT